MFSLYPYYKKFNDSHPVNGGLPEVENNITKLIPNTNFNGLAVIGLKEWRPRYNQNNWGATQVFRRQLIRLARTHHFLLKDEKKINETAEEDFKATK
ncbi:unnamed protein product [Strongylus vulgaris]|uniref:Hyaluronidase n=1 Tax=Strongylus vulgaris TaxID=40348 RepID=A0A3P7LMJ7_STRVU|nr:unnamed protein product [Strongylus vulgaris]